MNLRFKLARQSLNLTQQELGDILGISKSAVSKIESGKSAITERNVRVLSEKLDINPLWLKEGKGDMLLNIKEDFVDQLVREYKLDEDSEKIVRSFLQLDPERRKIIVSWMKETFTDTDNKKEE